MLPLAKLIAQGWARDGWKFGLPPLAGGFSYFPPKGGTPKHKLFSDDYLLFYYGDGVFALN